MKDPWPHCSHTRYNIHIKLLYRKAQRESHREPAAAYMGYGFMVGVCVEKKCVWGGTKQLGQ